MKKLGLLLAAALMLSACTSPEEATKTLSSQGFKNIETKGYSVFGCSQDDTFHTEFEATSPTGDKVSGVVCSGILKGATVRFD